VQPAHADKGIPINAEVRVRYQPNTSAAAGFVDGLPAPTLVDAQGKLVAAQVEQRKDMKATLYILRPKAPLSPNSTFTVQDGFGSKESWCGSFDAPCVSAASVAGSFTTAAQADTSPPFFVGLLGFDASWQSCGDSNCCGPFAGYQVALQWGPATDDSDAKQLRYNVYRMDGGKKALASFAIAAVGSTVGGYLAFASNLGVLADGDYQVCAIDLAGNESCPNGSKTFVAPAPPAPDAAPDTDGGATGADAGDAAGEVKAGGVDADTASEVATDAGAETVDFAGEVAADGGTASDGAVEVQDTTQSPGKPLPTPKPKDSGCSAGPGAPAGGVAWLALVVLVWLRRRPA